MNLTFGSLNCWCARSNIKFPLQIEMQTMLSMGVPPSKIVYANPCKQASHLRLVHNLRKWVLPLLTTNGCHKQGDNKYKQTILPLTYLVVWKLTVLSFYIYRFSAEHCISLMTFDNEMELHKIKKLYPTARWIKLSVWLKTSYIYSWFIFTRYSYYNQSTFIPPNIKKTYLKLYLQIGSLNISVFANYV